MTAPTPDDDAAGLRSSSRRRAGAGDEGRGRLAGLQAALAARGLDAALLVQNADLYYFAGTVQQSYLYVPAEGEPTLFTRKLVERARLESPLEHVVELPAPRDLPAAHRRALRRPAGARRAPSSTCCPSPTFRRLEGAARRGPSQDVGRGIVRQRAVKSPWEIERIRAAAASPTRCTPLVPGLLREGLTEAEFAGAVEAEARRLGHEGVIRMRGFNQEMFYGQLLTGVSGTAPTLPRHAAGRDGPEPGRRRRA